MPSLFLRPRKETCLFKTNKQKKHEGFHRNINIYRENITAFTNLEA